MLAYRQRMDDKLWLHGDLLAHIYNCWMQKPDKSAWTYRDFVRLTSENVEKKEKLTLKKAKQTLGSSFKLHDN